MNDLIIRITGTVEASNLTEYRETALAEIRAANKKLVTDDDFAAAELVAKRCKEAEDAIAAAKVDALAQTSDINSLFMALDSLSEELRCTRLSLSKQIDAEKTRRKEQIVKAGIDRYAESRNAHEPFVTALLPASIVFISDAIKGKKTVASMEAAVNKAVNDWIADNERRATDIRLCAEIIAAATDYQTLFADKQALCSKPPGEVAAIVESRVAKFKLEQVAKADRERTDAAAQLILKKDIHTPTGQINPDIHQAMSPNRDDDGAFTNCVALSQEEHAAKHAAKADANIAPLSPEKEQWMVVMLVKGPRADAVEVAKLVDAHFSEDNRVSAINLRQGL